MSELDELRRRRALTEDAARPEAVERRHSTGGRTARENVADLVDPGSFVEYGRFAIAAQRGRRELQELIERTPADGLVAGTARVNGELFGERAACAVRCGGLDSHRRSFLRHKSRANDDDAQRDEGRRIPHPAAEAISEPESSTMQVERRSKRRLQSWAHHRNNVTGGL